MTSTGSGVAVSGSVTASPGGGRGRIRTTDIRRTHPGADRHVDHRQRIGRVARDLPRDVLSLGQAAVAMVLSTMAPIMATIRTADAVSNRKEYSV